MIDLAAARHCARIAASHYRIAGVELPPTLRAHIEAVEAGAVHGTESDSDSAELSYDDPISTTEAASILGCSARWVRTIAADLDGKRVGRQWVFDKAAVTHYQMARGPG